METAKPPEIENRGVVLMAGEQTKTALKRTALALLSAVLFAALTLGCASVDEPEPDATAPDPDAPTGTIEAGNEDTPTDTSEIILRADSGYEAAEALVSALGKNDGNLASGYPYAILDYELLGWGVNEIDVDDSRVIGWIRYAVLPADDDEVILTGGAYHGEGKHQDWLVNPLGFSLEKQADGTWRCTGMGGGLFSMLYSGHTLAPAYAEGWDYCDGDWRLGNTVQSDEEYFARLADYGYDWYADPNGDVELDIISGGGYIDPYAVEQEGDTLYLYKYENGEKQYVRPLMTIPGVKLLNYDRNWLYCLVGGTDLVCLSYTGSWNTLFLDETGLIARIEQDFVIGGKQVIYFLAGLPDGGAAFYRVKIPGSRTDVLYTLTQEEIEALNFTAYDLLTGEAADGYQIGSVRPISNQEFIWVQNNRAFHELGGKILADPAQYADYYRTPDGEFVFDLFAIRDDYGLYPYSVHYYNAQTGEHKSADRLGYSEGNPTRWWLEES